MTRSFEGVRDSRGRVRRLAPTAQSAGRKPGDPGAPPSAGLLQNLEALMNLPGIWIDRAAQRRARDKLILDLDSSASETYGRQEGSA